MSNNTLADVYLACKQSPTCNERFLLVCFWQLVTGFSLAYAVIQVFFLNKLRSKMMQKMFKSESKLTELIAKFKHVTIHAERLLADADAFTVPLHNGEIPVNLAHLKRLIPNIDAVARKDNNDITATPFRTLSSTPKNFMQHAEECIAIIAYARKALHELTEHGFDDAVSQIVASDASCADREGMFAKLAKLEAESELEDEGDEDDDDHTGDEDEE
ncbi:uncharacterized protein ColSpa_05874 [Colletotrichum spaethianum]|uniref:Uncharacterized protein n=1 Tax=Colletotrichum spaethianum TaxID=700344 RepID=A0AA37LFT7_9PEZI|nr:uncharacterized protein ColSpa_05874 [Colletotrichum spaethianum]GKT45693.1 hypothetical protein ColSpa_05874 [Colletotrichum spaethianum]